MIAVDAGVELVVDGFRVMVNVSTVVVSTSKNPETVVVQVFFSGVTMSRLLDLSRVEVPGLLDFSGVEVSGLLGFSGLEVLELLDLPMSESVAELVLSFAVVTRFLKSVLSFGSRFTWRFLMCFLAGWLVASVVLISCNGEEIFPSGSICMASSVRPKNASNRIRTVPRNHALSGIGLKLDSVLTMFCCMGFLTDALTMLCSGKVDGILPTYFMGTQIKLHLCVHQHSGLCLSSSSSSSFSSSSTLSQ